MSRTETLAEARTGEPATEPNKPQHRDRHPRAGQWFRRNTLWIILALLFAGLVTYLVVDRQAAAQDSRRLSANNPGPGGAMAVAEILSQHGVDVTSTDTLEETTAALERDPDASLLLYDPRGFLDGEQLSGLRDSANRMTVVSPRLTVLRALDADIRPGGVVPEDITTLNPACGVEDAQAAGPVAARGAVYSGPAVCYPIRDGGPGLYAAVEGGRLVVLGSTDLLDNQHLADQGNAALAIRTLGTTQKLVWYLPSVADIQADRSAPTLSELAPPWVAVAGPWLGFVALLAIAWRARRLGPLVFEPLPVVVKAAETAEGRARLYQDSRALRLAADTLRAGTLTRLARHFKLGADATPDAVVDALAYRLGRPVPEMQALLLSTHPETEGHLVQWAQRMEQIEQEAMGR
ncbi:DUF4350 domain-containing protein [Arthrobacter sp. TES]|uniref:DUF4350 domain-containing protein n=1 Tax=Paenarthrobacter ureafaciens TaxID=37931 RepID=A0AAX3EEE5_PAEUR|nr:MULTISPECIES: DUF4350 domain-containing protein [Paenarthrobacter]AOY70546.1 hypothetical protein ARZXY2_987 [Arthrobacter sp. ZXY-2]QOI62751.1 DUF4350 domain-containing protein [Arthrobacter sp. TES]MDO5865449.1 DUF4350 domain-containing protein [Paenarthrobacter sp. SD-2]MDO5876541.1 DUF4350 domain-containing protein [Paenarthrobacter sp. SD-1]QMU83224.1 DUF4350 domain-containing protein [Paenarthrobacter ureafaciens]